MPDMTIGGSKLARRGYSFDEVAVAPSRRTRDASDVSLDWNIDAYSFATPLIAAPMDSVVSPTTAVTLGGLGVPAALNLEGLWTRYEDPAAQLAEIAGADDADATKLLQHLYQAA